MKYIDYYTLNFLKGGGNSHGLNSFNSRSLVSRYWKVNPLIVFILSLIHIQ